MKVKYSFVCDAANFAQTGNLNVLGIFKSISAGHFPCTHCKFTYIAHLEFHRSEIGKHKFKLNFIDDDGKSVLPPLNGEMDVHPENLWGNIMLDVQNVVFPKPGTYQIDLTVDNQHASTDIISVVQNN